MFAGKTAWLLARIRHHHQSGRHVFVGKPCIDGRYDSPGAPALHSHDGDSLPAIPLPVNAPLLSSLTTNQRIAFAQAQVRL